MSIGTKNRLAVVVAAVIAGFALTLCAEEHPGAEPPKMKPDMEKKAAKPQSVYVCPDCHVMAMKAGTCGTCEKNLVQKRLLGVKDGKAMLCDCPADCTCDAKGVTDGKCACGKTVAMMTCKGLHCCPMGCPSISKTEGKCPSCGMTTKTCE